jgi:hypothetical protein
MADPVTAIIGSTVASVGGSLIGGRSASKAAGKAADTQADAARYAADLQREQFERSVELQEPFRQAGLTAQNKLLDVLGLKPGGSGVYARDFGMRDFQADPGYAFRMSEGLKGLDRQAAARGGLISGAALRGAQRFGQELGSQEYMNAFNRYQTNRANQLNPLQSLAGVGQTTSNQLATQGQQFGANMGELALQGGNARASGYIGQANAMNQSLGGVANAIGQGVGMYNFMNPQGGGVPAMYRSPASGGFVV